MVGCKFWESNSDALYNPMDGCPLSVNVADALRKSEPLDFLIFFRSLCITSSRNDANRLKASFHELSSRLLQIKIKVFFFLRISYV